MLNDVCLVNYAMSQGNKPSKVIWENKGDHNNKDMLQGPRAQKNNRIGKKHENNIGGDSSRMITTWQLTFKCRQLHLKTNQYKGYNKHE